MTEEMTGQVAENSADAETHAEPSMDFDVVIDEWIARFVCNSDVSRHTPAMNHLTLIAIPALKTMLKEQ